MAKSLAYGKRVRIYPLSQASAPQPTVFTDVMDVVFDSTIRYDTSFFEKLNRIVQTEPWLERDRVMIDQLTSLGIEKGKPFVPSVATKKSLEAGIREARMALAARYDAGLPPFFEGTHWTFPVPPELIQAGGGPASRNPTPTRSTGRSTSISVRRRPRARSRTGFPPIPPASSS